MTPHSVTNTEVTISPKIHIYILLLLNHYANLRQWSFFVLVFLLVCFFITPSGLAKMTGALEVLFRFLQLKRKFQNFKP